VHRRAEALFFAGLADRTGHLGPVDILNEKKGLPASSRQYLAKPSFSAGSLLLAKCRMLPFGPKWPNFRGFAQEKCV
jgi:hypothetical protein